MLTYCLSAFNHFVGLALKGLSYYDLMWIQKLHSRWLTAIWIRPWWAHQKAIFKVQCDKAEWERHAITLAIFKTRVWYVANLKHFMVCCSLVHDSFMICTRNYTFYCCAYEMFCLSIFKFSFAFLRSYNYFQLPFICYLLNTLKPS